MSSFIKIGAVVLPLWVVENRLSPLLWPLVIQQPYYRTSRDIWVCRPKSDAGKWYIDPPLVCALCTFLYPWGIFRLLSIGLSVSFPVGVGCISSETSERNWLKFCTGMEVYRRHCFSYFCGDRLRSPAKEAANVPWWRYCASVALTNWLLWL